MARFAVVAPPPVLQKLDEHGVLGETHLLLAHDVVKKSSQYFDLFRRRGTHIQRWKFPFSKHELIILDNSIIELGAAVNSQMIVTAAKIVHPTIIVLPDVILDCKATIKKSIDALFEWTTALVFAGYDNLPIHYMAVVQGKTIDELLLCVQTFSKYSAITCWGIPRALVKQLGSRCNAIEAIRRVDPIRDIHMLGFSDDIYDDMYCAQDPTLNVTSIDSAVPLRHPNLLKLTSQVPARGDWWDNPDLSYFETTLANLDRVRSWCRGSAISQVLRKGTAS
jgi:hypothetical protein